MSAEKYYYSYVERDEGPAYHSLVILSARGETLKDWNLLPKSVKIFDWNDWIMTVEFEGNRCALIEQMEAAHFSSSAKFDADWGGVSAKTCPEYLAAHQKEILKSAVDGLGHANKKPKI